MTQDKLTAAETARKQLAEQLAETRRQAQQQAVEATHAACAEAAALQMSLDLATTQLHEYQRKESELHSQLSAVESELVRSQEMQQEQLATTSELSAALEAAQVKRIACSQPHSSFALVLYPMRNHFF